MAEVQCSNCGGPNSPDFLFCSKCGAKRQSGGTAPPPPGNEARRPTGPQRSQTAAFGQPRKAPRQVIWLVGVVAVLIVILIIRSWISRVSTERETKRLIETSHGAEAVAILQQKIQGSPNDANLYLLLGKAFLSTGDLMQAQERFNQAVAIDSSKAAEAAKICFDQGQNAFASSNTGSAQQLLAMAVKFDPSLAAKVAEQFYSKGKAAFQLHDMNSAEQLFGQAIQFDPSVKSKIAGDFADAANAALGFNDLEGAERYAKEAVSYDPGSALKHGQATFDKLTQSLCNLHALGKPRFMAMMKLSDDFGLPDATKETIPYRFAYGMELYENGPKPQGIDILRDIARDSPKSCEGAEANYALSPPPQGRITIQDMPPVTVGNNLTVQLLYVYVDVFSPNSIRLTFSMRAGDNPVEIHYAKPGPRTDQNQLLYILDDNGTKLSTTTGWVDGSQSRRCDGCDARQWQGKLTGGEQAKVYADFPLPTAGSNALKFVSPNVCCWSGEWSWPDTKIKRDLFE